MILVVILGVASVVVWWLARSEEQTAPHYVGQVLLRDAEWETYSDPRVGWSLRYPSRWHLQLAQPFECQGDAVVVTNLDADLRHPDLGASSCTGFWDMRALPSNFAVVEIDVPNDMRPGRKISQRSTPLSLEDALDASSVARFGVPKGIFIPVYTDASHQYIVRMWQGPEASPRDSEIAEAIVRSIEFET